MQNSELYALARQLSHASYEATGEKHTLENPFTGSTSDPQLDPSSEKFSLEAWLRATMQLVTKKDQSYSALTYTFSEMTVSGYTGGSNYQKTFFNALWSIPQKAMSWAGVGRRLIRVDILQDLSGIVRSGETLLVLGRPGSGCSTFLRTIAGEMYSLELSSPNAVQYEGITYAEMHSRYRGESIYSAETDVHFPILTVGETLGYAARARTPRNRIAGVSREQYALHMRDVVMAAFGLTHTRDTIVGSDFVRGVSGGERKRVSIAEVFLSHAPIQFWDNSTRGLDSANALEFVRALRLGTRFARSSAAVSLYQCSQDAYDSFDKVTVLYEGHQIYFGPANAAKSFFTSRGWHCPARQTTADFLTSLTNPAERSLLPGWEGRVPQTAPQFAKQWRESDEYQSLRREISRFEQENPIGGAQVEPFVASHAAQKARHTPKNSSYTLSFFMQVRLCTARGFTLFRRDPINFYATVIGYFVIAMILGSIFYNQKHDTSSLAPRGTVLFFVVLINGLSPHLETFSLFYQRPVVEKLEKYAHYHPNAEVISSLLCSMPLKIGLSVAFNVTLYFMSNLRREAGAFFVCWFFSFMLSMAMSSIYRWFITVCKDLTTSISPLGEYLIVSAIYFGYIIPVNYMHPWFRWIGYINVFSYAFEAIAINEFAGRTFPCANVVPSGTGYDTQTVVDSGYFACNVATAEPGEFYVNGDRYLKATYSYIPAHKWRCMGIIIAFWVFFTVLYFLCSAYVRMGQRRGEVLVFPRGKLPRLSRDEEEGTSRQPRAKRELEGKLRGTPKAKPDEGDSCGSPESNVTSRTCSKESSKGEQDIHVAEAAPVKRLAASRSGTTGTMRVPHTSLHWHDISYTISTPHGPRRLLSGVDGWAEAGTLTALMGASGAGKTTLLDVLAARAPGSVSGEIRLNGQARDAAFQRSTAYVQQQDIHLPTETVRDALRFSALMRQPNTVSREDKFAFVEEVIVLLEMEAYADAVIGAPGVGLNAEQRKRLTIGVELAARPNVLFFDEPTSGLDSQTAWAMCQLMRRLADEGHAVLCTIHQPSGALMEEFDRLILLKTGGETVYLGDVGAGCADMIGYFERHGAPTCPEAANPAEWMLQVIGAAPGHVSEVDWHATWRDSPEYKKVQTVLGEMGKGRAADGKTGHGRGAKQGEPKSEASSEASEAIQATEITQSPQSPQSPHRTPLAPSTPPSPPPPPPTPFALPLPTQVRYAAMRLARHHIRSPAFLYSKLALVTFCGLMVGFSFYRAPNTLQGLQNQLFGIYMLSNIFQFFTQFFMPVFIDARNVFDARERPAKTYAWPAFLLAYFLVDLPWQALSAVILYFTWYYPMGLYRNATGAVAARGVQTFLAILLMFIHNSAFALMTSAAVPTYELSGTIGYFLFLFALFFCGILTTPQALPHFWVWMYRISPFSYLVEALMTAGVAHAPITCADVELVSLVPPANVSCASYLAEYLATHTGYLVDGDLCQYCPYSKTDELLATYGMRFTHYGRNIGILFGYVIASLAIAFGSYWLFRVPHRRR